jgi:hypothetical protein
MCVCVFVFLVCFVGNKDKFVVYCRDSILPEEFICGIANAFLLKYYSAINLLFILVLYFKHACYFVVHWHSDCFDEIHYFGI